MGGETLEETAVVANKLGAFNVQVILDYGVEGKEGEDNFDHASDEFIRVIKYASTQRTMPFMSIKVTGFARFALLEKLDAAATDLSGYQGTVHTEELNEEEKAEWDRVVKRMERIISAAADHKIGVLVDAEETWIQDPVDALTMQMMEKIQSQQGSGVQYDPIVPSRQAAVPERQFCAGAVEAIHPGCKTGSRRLHGKRAQTCR